MAHEHELATGQTPISNLLLQQATRRQPVRVPLQSLGRLAQAFVGARMQGQERARQEELKQARIEALRKVGADLFGDDERKKRSFSFLAEHSPEVAEKVAAQTAFADEKDEEKPKDFRDTRMEAMVTLTPEQAKIARRDAGKPFKSQVLDDGEGNFYVTLNGQRIPLGSDQFSEVEKPQGTGKKSLGNFIVEQFEEAKRRGGLHNMPLHVLEILQEAVKTSPMNALLGEATGMPIAAAIETRRKMDEAARLGVPVDLLGVASGGVQVTEQDIEATMKENPGLTREQVIQRAREIEAQRLREIEAKRTKEESGGFFGLF